MAVARLTLKRLAAWRREAPCSMAATTRSRRSADKADGMAALRREPPIESDPGRTDSAACLNPLAARSSPRVEGASSPGATEPGDQGEPGHSAFDDVDSDRSRPSE